MTDRDTSTPEGFLTVPADMPAGYPIDAITYALSRAEAVLTMVTGQFDGSGTGRYCDSVIAGALCAVSGELSLIRTMVYHGFQTEGGLHDDPTH